MSARAVLVDGEAIAAGAARFFAERGLHYGDGLFETVALVHGRPLFWEAHLRRMARGASILGIPMPAVGDWEADLSRLQALSGPLSHGVLKLILTRGPGWGYAPPAMPTPRRYAGILPWPDRPGAHWHPGIRTAICPTPLATGAPYLTVKSLNRLNQIQARRALSPEYPEGILLDGKGVLREGIMSNLFWVEGGRLCTPRLDDGGIAGIQRAAIMDQGRSWGLEVREEQRGPEALAMADELFFCNSLMGIWPVRHFGARSWPGSAGAVAAALLAWSEGLGLGPRP
ncbi:MAG: aminodeoxychorismate lyase [Acidithiobacillus sp.]|uniref:aminodeoxychorismate lyase n=1 Tax=Acidithiobacillus sp. TaxID=1872118 RepID=UPI003CFDDAFF